MHMALAIQYNYPNAVPFQDFIVRDDSDGKGEYIDYWNLTDPQPTTDQLNTWWIGYLKQNKIAELTKACDDAIAGGFTATNGHMYQYTPNDQANINKQLTLLLLNATITDVQWKTLDAGVVDHTRDDFISLATDASNHERTNIGKLWQLEASVNSAMDEKTIQAVVWV